LRLTRQRVVIDFARRKIKGYRAVRGFDASQPPFELLPERERLCPLLNRRSQPSYPSVLVIIDFRQEIEASCRLPAEKQRSSEVNFEGSWQL
jgi:hypothetical protein